MHEWKAFINMLSLGKAPKAQQNAGYNITEKPVHFFLALKGCLHKLSQ